jgi:hypothetical protein
VADRSYSRGSSVGIATDYGLEGRGSIPGRVRRFSSSPQRLDQLWSTLSLLLNGYWGLFPLGVKRQGYDSHLVPRQRMMEV